MLNRITYINIQIQQHFLHNSDNDPVISEHFTLFLADISVNVYFKSEMCH